MQMTRKTVSYKSNKKRILGHVLYYTLGVLLTVFFLFPFFALVSRSFMTVQEVADIPKPLLPEALNFENYIAPFKDIESEINILRSIWNSVSIMILKTVGVTLTSFLCALHIYAKFNFWRSCGFLREAFRPHNERCTPVTA